MAAAAESRGGWCAVTTCFAAQAFFAFLAAALDAISGVVGTCQYLKCVEPEIEELLACQSGVGGKLRVRESMRDPSERRPNCRPHS